MLSAVVQPQKIYNNIKRNSFKYMAQNRSEWTDYDHGYVKVGLCPLALMTLLCYVQSDARECQYETNLKLALV